MIFGRWLKIDLGHYTLEQLQNWGCVPDPLVDPLLGTFQQSIATCTNSRLVSLIIDGMLEMVRANSLI